MQKVSFNGLDGSGKSQQIRMLSRDFSQLFYVTRPLTEYSSRWPKLHGSEMSRWWFETVSADELTDIIIESLNKREKDQCKGKITILDRGWRMFKAVCVATWLTREKVGIQEAMVETTRRFLAKLEYEPSEFEILLVPNNEYFQSVESIKSILNFTDDVFPKHMRQRYARYQSHLQKAVRACFMDKSPLDDSRVWWTQRVWQKQFCRVFEDSSWFLPAEVTIFHRMCGKSWGKGNSRKSGDGISTLH
ncbi:MAG: hypothetical protein UT91_C0014G0031 [Parcubacteria group bacterium GW2011_GWA2_40_23]|nr:MAG: hypothetical protein UT91_C0014G0031 [Parcubacteria group bacterium GW2011_GWA2_40_23]